MARRRLLDEDARQRRLREAQQALLELERARLDDVNRITRTVQLPRQPTPPAEVPIVQREVYIKKIGRPVPLRRRLSILFIVPYDDSGGASELFRTTNGGGSFQALAFPEAVGFGGVDAVYDKATDFLYVVFGDLFEGVFELWRLANASRVSPANEIWTLIAGYPGNRGELGPVGADGALLTVEVIGADSLQRYDGISWSQILEWPSTQGVINWESLGDVVAATQSGAAGNFWASGNGGASGSFTDFPNSLSIGVDGAGRIYGWQSLTGPDRMVLSVSDDLGGSFAEVLTIPTGGTISTARLKGLIDLPDLIGGAYFFGGESHAVISPDGGLTVFDAVLDDSPQSDYGFSSDILFSGSGRAFSVSFMHGNQIRFRYSDDYLTWSDFEVIFNGPSNPNSGHLAVASA